MIYPSNRPPTPSTPSIAALAPVPGSEPTDTPDDDCPAHTDYNLHPLRVLYLDHYVEQEDEGRFHVR